MGQACGLYAEEKWAARRWVVAKARGGALALKELAQGRFLGFKTFSICKSFSILKIGLNTNQI
jgi:hypothetical protein